MQLNNHLRSCHFWQAVGPAATVLGWSLGGTRTLANVMSIIQVLPDSFCPSHKIPLFVVERKGLGHPDSLADLLAETFSNTYSRHSLSLFGCILNHWSDKVLLRGGKAKVDFGTATLLEPITAYLFGRTTNTVGDTRIDVDGLFRSSANEVFGSVFDDCGIPRHIAHVVATNDSLGADHSPDYYHPGSPEAARNVTADLESNDTVMCSAYAPLSTHEYAAIALERLVNSPAFKEEHSYTGYDVKVMVVARPGERTDITVCVPFLASNTPCRTFYESKVLKVQRQLTAEAKNLLADSTVRLHINTKDRGRYAYLTVFGSSLDKGDFGVAGRGNRANGVVSLTREAQSEAVSGKNPRTHAGKLCAVAAQSIANEVFMKLGIENGVNIVTRNGEPLDEPAFVFVKLEPRPVSRSLRDKVRQIVGYHVAAIPRLAQMLIMRNPVAAFSDLGRVPARLAGAG